MIEAWSPRPRPRSFPVPELPERSGPPFPQRNVTLARRDCGFLLPLAVYLSSGSTTPSVQRSTRVSTASSCSLTTRETPSSSARRRSVSRLVRSIVSSVLRPRPVTGCSRISASSDGVKILLRFSLPDDIWHVLMAVILLGTYLSNAVRLVSATFGQRHRVTQPRQEELLPQ
jgi:hypothetical protein